MKSLKFLVALLFVASFALFAQDPAITAMVEKAQADLGKGMVYTNGDFVHGTLKKGQAYYATLTFYKSNKYSIAFGGSDKVKNMKVYLYQENMLNPVKKEMVGPNETKVITIEPKSTVNYYLKVFLEDGADDAGWFYFYGFKE